MRWTGVACWAPSVALLITGNGKTWMVCMPEDMPEDAVKMRFFHSHKQIGTSHLLSESQGWHEAGYFLLLLPHL